MDNNTPTDFNLEKYLHKYKLELVTLACQHHSSLWETAAALGINRNSLAKFISTYMDYDAVMSKFKGNKQNEPKVADIRKLQHSIAKADKLRLYIEQLNKKRAVDTALKAAEDEKLERLQRYRDKELREQAILAGMGITLPKGKT